MRKRTYVILGAILLAALGGCGNDNSAKEEANRAKESNQKLQEEEKTPFEFREEDGIITLTKYNGEESDVEIPEEYNNKKVTAIAETAFQNYGSIKSITIPCTIQNIENNMLPEQCSVNLKIYRHSMGEVYAMRKGLQYTVIGDNETQTSKVQIYDKEGKFYEELSLGKKPKEEFLKGVTFQEVDGKSVLKLDNVDIGAVVVPEFAALTVELAEGSSNTITGERGSDGINSNGSITIKGNGSLNVFGSDLFSRHEGEQSRVGNGIYTFGDLTIEDQVQLMTKAGGSRSRISNGILIDNGNLIVKSSKIEAYGGASETNQNCGAVIIYNSGDEQYGKLELTDAKIAEGGQLIPMPGEQYIYGYGIGTGTEIRYNDLVGYEGISNYIRIEPETQNK